MYSYQSEYLPGRSLKVVKCQGVGDTGGAIMSGFVKGIFYDGSSRSVHLILLHRISAPVLGLVALNLD